MMEEAVDAMEEALENSEWHCVTVSPDFLESRDDYMV